MRSVYKQALLLVIFASVIGLIFNFIRPIGIPLLAQIYDEIGHLEMEEFGIKNADLEQAKQLFSSEALFVDARDINSFNSGHIRNAIPSSHYESLIENIFNDYGFDKPIVVYCDDTNCSLSEELAYKLLNDGFSNLFVFSGGWDQWLEAGLPIKK